MTAGLPGTGIGGIFYLILALMMPFRELLLLVRGKSSPRRWWLIATQLGLVAGIVFILWLEIRILNALILWTESVGAISPGIGRTAQWGALGMAWSAFGSFITLSFVFLVIHSTRLILHSLPSRTPQPAPHVDTPTDGLAGKRSMAA